MVKACEKDVGENIKRQKAAGKSQKQAVAIGLSEAGKSKKDKAKKKKRKMTKESRKANRG